MVYAYFVTNPNELRFDVRDSFEEFVTGIVEEKGTTGEADDRPIQEQALGMMDQLAAMEEMMQTNTFTDVIERKSPPPLPQQSGPSFPRMTLE